MRYLLFTTPTGGYFSSMVDPKVQALNEFKVRLQSFQRKAADANKKGDKFPQELIDGVKCLEDLFETERQAAVDTSPVQRSGVYQWHEAFNRGGDTGEVRHTAGFNPQELDDYDIIHVNGCGSDHALITQLRQALGTGSSTHLIYNLDYAVNNWQGGFPTNVALQGFINSCVQADFVYATEPAQAALINHLLHHVVEPRRDKVSVPVIPNPCDVQGIRKAFVPHSRRLDRCMVCYHRYDQHLYLPWLVTNNILAKIGNKEVHYPIYVTGIGPDPINLPMFDGAFIGDKWANYIYELAHSTIGFEYYSIHSHSRYPEECAVLGIPVVGTMNSYSIARMHSLTAHSPLDFTGMRRSLKRLIEDEEFYKQCVAHCWKRVQEIDHKPSKVRLVFEMNKWLQLEGKQ